MPICVAPVLLLASLTALGPVTPTAPVSQEHASPDARFVVVSDNEIIANGVTYHSWDQLAAPGYHQLEETRCKALAFDFGDGVRSDGNDCSFSRTNIRAEYEPGVAKYRIPVVVHIIQSANGTGNIPDERVHSQIEVLNEDFQAIAGTNGAPGTDVQIEFYLATDNQGCP